MVIAKSSAYLGNYSNWKFNRFLSSQIFGLYKTQLKKQKYNFCNLQPKYFSLIPRGIVAKRCIYLFLQKLL